MGPIKMELELETLAAQTDLNFYNCAEVILGEVT